ncbi:MAG: hypothetical protein HY329_20740 [Chloroflexi bacterium]|nr:hypothetical protein [Chloroflexota bacterium]
MSTPGHVPSQIQCPACHRNEVERTSIKPLLPVALVMLFVGAGFVALPSRGDAAGFWHFDVLLLLAGGLALTVAVFLLGFWTQNRGRLQYRCRFCGYRREQEPPRET